MRAANQLAEKAVNVRSEARSAYQAYRSNYDIARHYSNSVVPLRTKIEEESLLTYNGMITNTFELLTDTRDKINSILLSVNAKRDFWLAEANLAPGDLRRRRGGSVGRNRRACYCRSAAAVTEKGTLDMFNRRQMLGAGAALLSTAAWAKTSATWDCLTQPSWNRPTCKYLPLPNLGARLPAGRDAERLDPAPGG
jgi:hypothetical protein